MRLWRAGEVAMGGRWQQVLTPTLLLLLLLCCTGGAHAKKGPKIKSSKFEHAPQNLQYFEDSDVILFQDEYKNSIYRSTDAGESWKEIKEVPKGDSWELWMHPFEHQRAYILTLKDSHWMTSNRGKSWEQFHADIIPRPSSLSLTFHAGDPDKIIFNGEHCLDELCASRRQTSVYTTDGFSSKAKPLRDDTYTCYWAKSSDIFTTGDKDLDAHRTLCVSHGKFSAAPTEYRLLISDNFFEEYEGDVQEFEPQMAVGRTVQGIVNIAIVKRYLVAAAVAEGTDEMALYVSDDTITWHQAVFPKDHRMERDAFTILESTNYSIQIDVMTTRNFNPMGVLLSSNSNGTYFTRNIEHTNRAFNGMVDFEKMSGIQGIIFVNVVDNWKKVEDNFFEDKKIKSKISFDDGRTFQSMKAGDKDLNVHSVTDRDNNGRIFSSPAPGIAMAVGSTDEFLAPYEKSDLYVSDNAGISWAKALDGPHKFEFGDAGSLLVAVKDELTNKIKYSIDYGATWEEADLPDKVIPFLLTTTQDSTSLKFIMLASEKRVTGDEKNAFHVISIDFEPLDKRTCKDKDYEKYHARVTDDEMPSCLMGHEQFYTRRKQSADCFRYKEFVDMEVKTRQCDCTDADFECDFNFVRSEDRSECVRDGDLVVPDGQCDAFDDSTKFKASSGWRLVPGNDCKRTSGKQKDDPVERKCSEAVGAPATGLLSHTQQDFHGDQYFFDKLYLERTESSSGGDETIIMRTDNNLVFLSNDHGKTWEEILKDFEISHIIQNQFFRDFVFFTTRTEVVHYTTNRGKSFMSFKAPTPPKSRDIMSFTPKNKDWFIWNGEVCDGDGADKCYTVASITTDRGDDWKTMVRYVSRCEFIIDTVSPDQHDKLIFCASRELEDPSAANNPLQLTSSTDFYEERTVHFKNIQGFATMREFIVVAAKGQDDYLRLDASIDGDHFAEAMFPPNFQVEHQEGYTVLDSSTHAVFLQVLVSDEAGFEYGSIIKSNSNGTSYALSINNVNRDSTGYVDFEKMYGLEGVAVVNVVANAKSKKRAEEKKLRTMITHNDGAEWGYLAPPAKDSEGKNNKCKGALEKCALHIHGYTERTEKSHTYSTATAVGLMLGVGNVGDHLTDFKDASTFVTNDAGITWTEAKKGAYMWAFVDQGAVIVLVKEREATNKIFYSRDEGKSWKDYKVSGEDLHFDDITTVPSANSRSVILWGHSKEGLFTISVDFSGLTSRQCTLDESGADNEDYYMWNPKHPKQNNDCLFGHVAQYHRKRVDADCYNGRFIEHLHDIAKDCKCERQDFECDFNYERKNDGSCKLVPGLKPLDHSQVCKNNPEALNWYEPTGYRRIPLDTCQGGRELEYTSKEHPCPGKEEEYKKKKHGMSGFGLFLVIVIPFAVAGAIGYWVWRNWEGHFGQIRLGEQSTFDGDQPYIKYPVMAIAASVSVAQALPLLAKSLWRSALGALGRGSKPTRFTTRDSFARTRGDYAVVDEDEGELLGDDSDEEA